MKLEQIADENKLHAVTTSKGTNGYPKDLKDAIIGFKNWEQAEKLAEKYELKIIKIHKRYGWDLFERNESEVHEPIKITAEMYGDDYAVWKGDNVQAYFDAEIKDRLADFNNWDNLATFINKQQKIISEIDNRFDDELIITYRGEYFDTVNENTMEWIFDSHIYEIALMER
jgi:hypothetical protein